MWKLTNIIHSTGRIYLVQTSYPIKKETVLGLFIHGKKKTPTEQLVSGDTIDGLQDLYRASWWYRVPTWY